MSASVVEVWAFTNADEAELFVNGKSAGRVVAGSGSHAVWKDVPYVPGHIEARVYANGNDTVLASQVIHATHITLYTHTLCLHLSSNTRYTQHTD
jgi:hypothetical protein